MSMGDRLENQRIEIERLKDERLMIFNRLAEIERLIRSNAEAQAERDRKLVELLTRIAGKPFAG